MCSCLIFEKCYFKNFTKFDLCVFGIQGSKRLLICSSIRSFLQSTQTISCSISQPFSTSNGFFWRLCTEMQTMKDFWQPKQWNSNTLSMKLIHQQSILKFNRFPSWSTTIKPNECQFFNHSDLKDSKFHWSYFYSLAIILKWVPYFLTSFYIFFTKNSFVLIDGLWIKKLFTRNLDSSVCLNG